MPIANYEQLRPSGDNDRRISTIEYQQAIGCLMFAIVLTRPDIAFVLGRLAQYMSNLLEHYRHALKNLIRYLNSTASQKLRYGLRGAYRHLAIYLDADWASDKSIRRSVSKNVAIFYN